MVDHKRKSGEMVSRYDSPGEHSPLLSKDSVTKSLRLSSTASNPDKTRSEIIDLTRSSPPQENTHNAPRRPAVAASRDADNNTYPSPYSAASPTILQYDAAKAKKGISYFPTAQRSKDEHYSSIIEHELANAKTKLARANDRALKLEQENTQLKEELATFSRVNFGPFLPNHIGFGTPQNSANQRIASAPTPQFSRYNGDLVSTQYYHDSPFGDRQQDGFPQFGESSVLHPVLRLPQRRLHDAVHAQVPLGSNRRMLDQGQIPGTSRRTMMPAQSTYSPTLILPRLRDLDEDVFDNAHPYAANSHRH